MPEFVPEVNEELTKELTTNRIKEVREDEDSWNNTIIFIFEDGRALVLTADDESGHISRQFYASWELALIDQYGSGPEREAAGFV